MTSNSSGRVNVSALAIKNCALTPAASEKKREISICRGTILMPVQQALYLTAAWTEFDRHCSRYRVFFCRGVLQKEWPAAWRKMGVSNLAETKTIEPALR
jgi:hypothetical protein